MIARRKRLNDENPQNGRDHHAENEEQQHSHVEVLILRGFAHGKIAVMPDYAAGLPGDRLGALLGFVIFNRPLDNDSPATDSDEDARLV